MIEGKDSYNQITIPQELDTVLASAKLNARRKKRAAYVKRMGAAAAAFLCVFVLSNNSTVYAKASGIPVLGTVVQFFHVGEGGVVTDGMKGDFIPSSGHELVVNFQGKNQERAPYYQVEYQVMPRRVTVALYGVREFDRTGLEEKADQCEGIKDLYFQTVLDDSQVKFTVELKDGIGWQIAEYKDPGSLGISFGTDYYEKDETSHLWTVRIPSMENGEPLAMVQELYGGYAMEHEGLQVNPEELQAVKTKNGLFTITAGTYGTEEEAKKAADGLNQAGFSDHSWYTEKLAVNENPN